MVVERLISKKEIYKFPKCPYVFHSKYQYWYDGRLFLIGRFYRNTTVMIERETGAMAVHSMGFPGKFSIEDLIEKFKYKITLSGKTIHEVIRDYKLNNNGIELWVINLLGI